MSFPIEVVTEFLPFCDSSLILAWQGFGGLAWNGPLYPDALAPAADCTVARSLKVRVSIQKSGTNGPPVQKEGLPLKAYSTFVYISGYEVVWPHQ